MTNSNENPTRRLQRLEAALAAVRQGRPVELLPAHTSPKTSSTLLVTAAETAGHDFLKLVTAGKPVKVDLALTARRAEALALTENPVRPCLLTLRSEVLDLVGIQAIADPTLGAKPGWTDTVNVHGAEADGPADLALRLMKLARLLPAALIVTIDGDNPGDRGIQLYADDIAEYTTLAAAALREVSRVVVPLADAEETEVVAYRPSDGGSEHLALIVGSPDPTRPVLARLHSQCMTGDLLGSLRCDCGDQLREAIRLMAGSNGGILVYLAQEGRDIGLINKLRAYRLQDSGVDTIEANEQLGFDSDERGYAVAAEILKRLGVSAVRLLTNNPDKVSALRELGISVTERVPLVMSANPHNERYLATKKDRAGHLI